MGSSLIEPGQKCRKLPAVNGDTTGPYFADDTAPQRESLRLELDAAARRLQSTSKTLKLDDAELLSRIRALGFDGETAEVFDLLPLVHVAWADGKIQRNERTTILRILEQRGIEPTSNAHLLVESLLEQKPSETFMGETLAVLQALIGEQPEQTKSLVDLCHQVAEASGNLLGLGARTSARELELIERVAEALGTGAHARFQERLRGE
jgi:uncharacterized tellurite resistance protein B-like protein